MLQNRVDRTLTKVTWIKPLKAMLPSAATLADKAVSISWKAACCFQNGFYTETRDMAQQADSTHRFEHSAGKMSTLRINVEYFCLFAAELARRDKPSVKPALCLFELIWCCWFWFSHGLQSFKLCPETLMALKALSLKLAYRRPGIETACLLLKQGPHSKGDGID